MRFITGYREIIFFNRIIASFGFADTLTEIMIWFGKSNDLDLIEKISGVEKERVMFQYGDVDWI